MPAQHHRHIALTEPLIRFVDRQVTECRYASASEVVRAGLRLSIEREAIGARPVENGDQPHG